MNIIVKAQLQFKVLDFYFTCIKQILNFCIL